MYSAGKKKPAGAHPGAQSLESTCVMYLSHKNEDSLFIKNRRCIFAGKNAPAGAHPGAPNLEGHLYILIYRNLYLPHRICIIETYICICNTYFSVCNTYESNNQDFECLITDICVLGSKNDGFGSEMGRR